MKYLNNYGKNIPKEIKAEVLQIVETFNKNNQEAFQISFRGKFAYLSKVKPDASDIVTKLGQLKYEGKMDNWSFAVFRYSSESYDADEFMFPGAFELDGTIEGALRAGIEIYPD